jgi:sugar lactone lactonase YvrE
MPTTKLALPFCLIVTASVMGCAGNSGPTIMSDAGNGGGGDGGNDNGDVPFTNGVSTLAGMATAGYVDGSRKIAQFSNPVNVAYRNGVLYVADFDNGKLRAIDTGTFITSTVIARPGFQRPFGLAFAADGTLYVTTDNDQTGNHTAMSGTIWKVDVTAHTATVVANAVGRPRGITVLPDGRLAVADYLHQVIELVATDTGKVTPIAGAWDAKGMVDGAGSVARFSSPYGVALGSDGKLIVADYNNNRIRVVGLDGTTATLAGTGTQGFADGAMNAAKFSTPEGVSVAANGDVYITDLGNFRVRRITGGHVDTVAGNGTGGYVDNDDRLASELYGLEGLAVVPDGSMLYVADGSRGDPVPYNRVRQIKLN